MEDTEGHRSVPLYQNGKFANPEAWGFKEKSFSDLFRWFTSGKRAAFPSLKEIEEKLPMLKPPKNVIESEEYIEKKGVQTTWIGHSTFLVQMEGCNILTDPVFYDHCSPIPFAGPKRYRPPALTLEQLPIINAVIVSHDHYDHLDVGAIKYLAKKSPETEYFVGRGMKDWFKGCGVPEEKIHDLSWWETSDYSSSLRMVCTPCQHWTKRSLTDTCKSLWSSWTLVGDQNTVYFAGDTGYCPAFKEIGEAYGPFDVSLIPIGAYCPRWFMKCSHINPEEAVKVHIDLCSKVSIGMHWGTFVLTDEDIFEPPIKLAEALKEQNVPENEFVTVFHGQTSIWVNGEDVLAKETL